MSGINSNSESTSSALTSVVESVTIVLDGNRIELPKINRCPAAPGLGLGFLARRDDLEVGGGFEGDRGQIRLSDSGTIWMANNEATPTGELSFTLDTREQITPSGLRAFVDVRASGYFSDETGRTRAFELEVTCEPGGT
jgi:hypothetical protein